MLGDGRDEVAGLKDLEIAPDLGIEARAVDDRFPRGIGMHFIQREGVTDDVLGEAFEILTTGGGDPSAAMDVESRVSPAEQHPGSLGQQEFLFDQKANDPCPEEFFQRCKAELGHDMKHPRARKESISYQGVEVGMKIEVFPEGMDRHDGSSDSLGKVQCRALKIQDAALGDAAEFLDESPMKTEVGAQHLRNADGDVSVRDRC